MFKVGDRVIAIKSDGYIEKDKIYIVKYLPSDTKLKLLLLENVPYVVMGEILISIREQRKQKLDKIFKL